MIKILDTLNIGPFLIRTSWLIIVASGLIGYFSAGWMAKQSKLPAKLISDIYFIMIIIIVLTWKFGPLLFNPSILIQSPMNIIYTMGTVQHLWLGIAIAFLYAFWQVRRKKISLNGFLDILPFGLLVFLIISQLLIADYGIQTNLPWGISVSDPEIIYHPINMYSAITGVIILVILWKKKQEIGNGNSFYSFLLLYGIGELIISYFEQPHILILGLTSDQLIYFGFIIMSGLIALYFSYSNKKKAI